MLGVGCGNGAAVIHAAGVLELDAVGVDIDPDQIRAATAAATGLPHALFQVADACALPLKDGEFDLVYTNKTTHHIPDWPQALAEMARVLKPGGHLLYSDFAAPFGRRLPTRRRLDDLAAALGLERLQRSRTPLHYTCQFRKPPPATGTEAGASAPHAAPAARPEPDG